MVLCRSANKGIVYWYENMNMLKPHLPASTASFSFCRQFFTELAQSSATSLCCSTCFCWWWSLWLILLRHVSIDLMLWRLLRNNDMYRNDMAVWLCHTPWQPLHNDPSGHFGGCVMRWSAEVMLDGQHQRVDIPSHARTAHNGLRQKTLEENVLNCLSRYPSPTFPMTWLV